MAQLPGGPRTEVLPLHCVHIVKTEPAPPLMVESGLSASFNVNATMSPHKDFQVEGSAHVVVKNYSLIGDALTPGDPESDISSSSGRSFSLSAASTPMSRASGLSQDNSLILPRTLSEGHRNTNFASHMRVSRFRQVQSRLRWDKFEQGLKEGLP